MARQQFDIGLDADGKLLIVGGDIVVLESTAQHQRKLLKNNKGDLKQNPLVGVGLASFIDDEGQEGLKQEISEQFTADGMVIDDWEVNQGGLANNSVKIFEHAYYQ